MANAELTVPNVAKVSNFTDLPNDIQQNILNFLDRPTLGTIQRVNQSLNESSKENLSRRELDLVSFVERRYPSLPPLLALKSEIYAYSPPEKRKRKKHIKFLNKEIYSQGDRVCREFGFQRVLDYETEEVSTTTLLEFSELHLRGEFPLFRPYFVDRILPRFWTDMDSFEMAICAVMTICAPYVIPIEGLIYGGFGGYHLLRGSFSYSEPKTPAGVRGKSVKRMEKLRAEFVPNLAFSKLVCGSEFRFDQEAAEALNTKIDKMYDQFLREIEISP
jgi:hypothetical protein